MKYYQYYLIFDIETTGYPEDFDAPVEDFENWPGILEIAWQLYDDRINLIEEKSILIRSDGCKISDEVVNLTGISSDKADKDGISILTALKNFSSKVTKFNPILVAHNIDFDINIVQAHLEENFFLPVNLKEQKQICTMKKTKSFCDLPNQKFPKLSELYKVLFSDTPTDSHRALADVKTTAKSFFKLVDIGVIPISKPRSNISVDIDIPDSTEVKLSILNYKDDLNRYPLFYDFDEISIISDDIDIDLTKDNFNKSFIKIVKDNFNKYYQTNKANTFEIPYNRVINRTATALKSKDMIVRYLLTDHLKKNTNFIRSIKKYDESTINKLIEKHLKEGQRIVVKIDIYNCYESIEHKKLIRIISDDLNLNTESLFVSMLNNSLKVIYEDIDGMIKRKEKGLLIGSKPDEYLAEYFLENIADNIQDNGISVIRIADEFIFFSNSIDTARTKFKRIREIIESYNLEINNSKTTITDHRGNSLQHHFYVQRFMVDGTIPYLAYELSDLDEKEDRDSMNNCIEENDFVSSAALHVETKENQQIKTYDSSLSFLKKLLHSQKTIKSFQENHPEHKKLYNLEYSELDDFKKGLYDAFNLLFIKETVKKLKKIIVHYPKSEYYSGLALQLLSFLVKNSIYYQDKIDFDNSFLEGITLKLHDTCVESNLTVIDLLKSNDVHQYQKYLLLNFIFKKENNLSLDISEYNIELIVDSVHTQDFSVRQPPFKAKVLEEVEHILGKTSYYPLKMICSEIVKMKKSNK